MNARDQTAVVQLQVRLREDLRRSLEEAARAKRISLNQEIVDRLEYARDRQRLVAEVLHLTFGAHIGGLLVLIGSAMASAVRDAGYEPTTDTRWTSDTTAHLAIENVAHLLLALRPMPENAKDDDITTVVSEAVAIATIIVPAKLDALAREKTEKNPGAVVSAVVEGLGPTLDAMVAESSSWQGPGPWWHSKRSKHLIEQTAHAMIDRGVKAYRRVPRVDIVDAIMQDMERAAVELMQRLKRELSEGPSRFWAKKKGRRGQS